MSNMFKSDIRIACTIPYDTSTMTTMSLMDLQWSVCTSHQIVSTFFGCWACGRLSRPRHPVMFCFWSLHATRNTSHYSLLHCHTLDKSCQTSQLQIYWVWCRIWCSPSALVSSPWWNHKCLRARGHKNSCSTAHDVHRTTPFVHCLMTVTAKPHSTWCSQNDAIRTLPDDSYCQAPQHMITERRHSYTAWWQLLPSPTAHDVHKTTPFVHCLMTVTAKPHSTWCSQNDAIRTLPDDSYCQAPQHMMFTERCHSYTAWWQLLPSPTAHDVHRTTPFVHCLDSYCQAPQHMMFTERRHSYTAWWQLLPSPTAHDVHRTTPFVLCLMTVTAKPHSTWCSQNDAIRTLPDDSYCQAPQHMMFTKWRHSYTAWWQLLPSPTAHDVHRMTPFGTLPDDSYCQAPQHMMFTEWRYSVHCLMTVTAKPHSTWCSQNDAIRYTAWWQLLPSPTAHDVHRMTPFGTLPDNSYCQAPQHMMFTEWRHSYTAWWQLLPSPTAHDVHRMTPFGTLPDDSYCQAPQHMMFTEWCHYVQWLMTVTAKPHSTWCSQNDATMYTDWWQLLPSPTAHGVHRMTPFSTLPDDSYCQAPQHMMFTEWRHLVHWLITVTAKPYSTWCSQNDAIQYMPDDSYCQAPQHMMFTEWRHLVHWLMTVTAKPHSTWCSQNDATMYTDWWQLLPSPTAHGVHRMTPFSTLPDDSYCQAPQHMMFTEWCHYVHWLMTVTAKPHSTWCSQNDAIQYTAWWQLLPSPTAHDVHRMTPLCTLTDDSYCQAPQHMMFTEWRHLVHCLMTVTASPTAHDVHRMTPFSTLPDDSYCQAPQHMMFTEWRHYVHWLMTVTAKPHSTWCSQNDAIWYTAWWQLLLAPQHMMFTEWRHYVHWLMTVTAKPHSTWCSQNDAIQYTAWWQLLPSPTAHDVHRMTPFGTLTDNSYCQAPQHMVFTEWRHSVHCLMTVTAKRHSTWCSQNDATMYTDWWQLLPSPTAHDVHRMTPFGTLPDDSYCQVPQHMMFTEWRHSVHCLMTVTAKCHSTWCSQNDATQYHAWWQLLPSPTAHDVHRMTPFGTLPDDSYCQAPQHMMFTEWRHSVHCLMTVTAKPHSTWCSQNDAILYTDWWQLLPSPTAHDVHRMTPFGTLPDDSYCQAPQHMMFTERRHSYTAWWQLLPSPTAHDVHRMTPFSTLPDDSYCQAPQHMMFTERRHSVHCLMTVTAKPHSTWCSQNDAIRTLPDDSYCQAPQHMMFTEWRHSYTAWWQLLLAPQHVHPLTTICWHAIEVVSKRFYTTSYIFLPHFFLLLFSNFDSFFYSSFPQFRSGYLFLTV